MLKCIDCEKMRNKIFFKKLKDFINNLFNPELHTELWDEIGPI